MAASATGGMTRPMPQPIVAKFEDYQPWSRTQVGRSKRDVELEGSPDTTRSERTITDADLTRASGGGEGGGGGAGGTKLATAATSGGAVASEHAAAATVGSDVAEESAKGVVIKATKKTTTTKKKVDAKKEEAMTVEGKGRNKGFITAAFVAAAALRHRDSCSTFTTSSLPTDGAATRCSHHDKASRAGSTLLNTFVVERPSRIRFGAKMPKTLPPIVASTTLAAAAAATTTTMTTATTTAAAAKQPIKTKSERKREENERARILMMKIKNLRDLIEEQKDKRAKLRTEIEALEMGKTEREDKVYGDVKLLLRRYEKFRGSVFALNSQAFHEKEERRRSVEKTRRRCERKKRQLDKQLLDVDERLEVKREQLQVLQTYKDKEYPAKALKIAELQKEIDLFNIANREDKSELEAIVIGEMRRMNSQQSNRKQQLTQEMTSRAILNLPSSLKSMMVENTAMTKEIKLHKTAQDDLATEIAALEHEMDLLRLRAKPASTKHPAASTKHPAATATAAATARETLSPATAIKPKKKMTGISTMFPEIFQVGVPCDPDADVVLNIPRQISLPI